MKVAVDQTDHAWVPGRSTATFSKREKKRCESRRYSERQFFDKWSKTDAPVFPMSTVLLPLRGVFGDSGSTPMRIHPDHQSNVQVESHVLQGEYLHWNSKR